MTVRNVRSYQTRGLIPPPRRQGRHSVYGAEHLQRLRQIHEARARGATLGLIGTHLSQGGSLNGEGLDRTWLPLRQAGPSTSGGPTAGRRRPRTASLDRMLAEAPDEAPVTEAVEGLVEAGLLQRSGERVVAERSFAAGVGNLAKHGLPLESTLEVAAIAVEAGRTLEAAMRRALTETAAGDRARGELIDLVAGVLGNVTTLRLAQAEQNGRPTPDRPPP
jgi:DNA-binding transcriptional MerR regulator